jgi:hypothetical protein
MKKITLILIFLVCFINYQGFAGGKGERKAIKDDTTQIRDDTTRIRDDTSRIKDDTSRIKDDTTQIRDDTSLIWNDTTQVRNDTTLIWDDTTQIKEGINKIIKILVPDPPPPQRIPVTPQITEFLLEKEENFKGVKFYLSNPLTLYEQKETAKIENKNGVVILNSANPDEIKISTDSEGIYIPFAEPRHDRNKELQIFFQKQDKTLIFTRRQNSYELSSVVMKENKSYRTDLFENIQLLLYGEDNREIKVHVVPVNIVSPDNPPPRDESYSEVGGKFTAGNKYGAIYIAGQGSLRKEDIIVYIRHKNRNIPFKTIENLIDMYISEAKKEGINHDIAIAQMCRTTNFLSNKAMQTHNYAGFVSTPGWSGRFTSMREGVIAHIQHLKGYTSNVLQSDNQNVDPRWHMLDGYRGTIHTLEDLSRKWVRNNSRGYENDIKGKINEMRRLSRLDI